MEQAEAKLTPPPMPQLPPRMPDAGSFARQAALASLLAPAISFGLNMLTTSVRQDSRAGNIVTGLMCSVFIVLGLVFAILALLGIKKHGKKGIFGRAIAGLLINSFIIVSSFLTFQHAKVIAAKHRLLAREKEIKQLEEDRTNSKNSFQNYPGWHGLAKVGETVIIITSLADESPSAKMLNSYRTMNVSIAQVIGINQSMNNSVMVDFAKAELALKDGRSVRCLPLIEILRSSKKDQDTMIAKYLGPHTIKPQSQFPVAFIHMPLGFAWGDVMSVTIHVDGKPVMVQGRLLTAAEKAAIFAAGQKAQEQQKNQPANTP